MATKVVCFLLPVLAFSRVSIPSRQIAPGVEMPVISIGTGGQERSAAVVITQNWLALGGRGVDTAHMYQNQRAVAQTIAKSGIDRKDIFITTKVPGCSNTTALVEDDLKELATDYIDLMLIHFPSGDCSAAWSTLEAYHAKGVLKAIGVSNFNKDDIDALMKSAKVTPAVNQIQFNILKHDDETIAACVGRNITVEAYSPLGRGGESGDIPGNKNIQAIAAAHSVSTYQVALKWILQKGHILTFQSSSQAHQQETSDVFNFSLTDGEMSTLDRLQKPGLLVYA